MKALIMGGPQVAALRKLKEHAEANPFSMDDLLDMKNNPELTVGGRKEFRCEIPFGYRVVFSIEPALNRESVMVRHLSMSIDVHNKLPYFHAVQMVMEELGFQNKIVDEEGKPGVIIVEGYKKGDFIVQAFESAIHVAEPVHPTVK